MNTINIVLQGNDIKIFTRRISCDVSTISSGILALCLLVTIDYIGGYIYCINQTDLDIVKSWLDSKNTSYGQDEDITPVSEIISWLASEENTGKVGIRSKSQIYTSLKANFTEIECIENL